ncbi:MAG: hypothetical protein MUF10_02085 [Thermoanaerobaculaceae bacterium]|nr:hypothetical protein [Thermoanaerobaculaceae bacterium]
MSIREGAWDCPACGRRRTRGPLANCPGCGRPRGPEVRFYLPDDAREVTDQAEIERARRGPDWSCAYCSGDSPADAPFCGHCGAARGDGTARTVQVLPDQPPAPAPVMPAPAAPAPRPKLTRGCTLSCLGLTGAVAVLAVIGWFASRPKPTTLVVTGHTWERRITTEVLETRLGEAWEGEAPVGARVLTTRQEVHHHDREQVGWEWTERTETRRVPSGSERVKTGVRDLGNGYFEDVYEDRPVYRTEEVTRRVREPVHRQVPVLKTRVSYEVESWEKGPEQRASGNSLDARWPDLPAGPGVREAGRTERYTVRFRDSAGRDVLWHPPDESRWRAHPPGRSVPAMVTSLGEITQLDGVEVERP